MGRAHKGRGLLMTVEACGLLLLKRVGDMHAELLVQKYCKFMSAFSRTRPRGKGGS